MDRVGRRQVLLLLSAACLIQGIAAEVCNPNPCKNGGTCAPPDKGYNWGYICNCPPAFYGSQCQWDNSTACNANTRTPCQNNGVCVIKEKDGRFCECPGSTETSVRYGGHYCEIVDPCRSCPSRTVYCQSAPTRPNSVLCLNSDREEIR